MLELRRRKGKALWAVVGKYERHREKVACEGMTKSLRERNWMQEEGILHSLCLAQPLQLEGGTNGEEEECQTENFNIPYVGLWRGQEK